MGLAASQARFLAITSRKMNCEFQSMQIAQDKLSVTRDMQRASQEYQNSLTKTKLVWNADGNGMANGDIYKMDYDTLMKPSLLNQYSPFLITESTGKIVLDPQMTKIAERAGINKDGTTPPDETGRNKFLDQLQAAGYIEPATNRAIQGSYSTDKSYLQGTIYQYDPKEGLGKKPEELIYSNIMNTNTFIDYLKNAKKNDITNLEGTPSDEYVATITGLANAGDPTATPPIPKGMFYDTDAKIDGSGDINNLNLGGILSQNTTIKFSNLDGDTTSSQLIDQFGTKLSEILCVSSTITDDNSSDSALDQAIKETKSYFTKSNGKVVDIFGTTYINLTEMLKTLLTYYALELYGYDQPYDPKTGNYVTSDLAMTYEVKNPGNSSEGNKIEEKTIYTAQFYNRLYNQLCANGYTDNVSKIALVKDEDYLSHAIKNGQLFISSLNEDGYFYQAPYTREGYIVEVPDEDAITQAQLEYEIIKSKLDYKEQTLDLKLKNIDTELSALTTEFDTVKNLIGKNVEKIFTMFST